MKYLLLAGLLPALLSIACGKESTPGTNTAPHSSVTPASTLPGEKAVITGNQVNIRSAAKTTASVLTQLNSGAEVGWLESVSAFQFSGKYHGRWIKVAIPDGREGFVFSSFLKRGGDTTREFHVFFENFEQNWKTRNEKAVLAAIELPLAAEASFEGETEQKSLTAEEIFETILLGGPYMNPLRFETAEDGVRCLYEYEGSSWTLSFRQRNGTWKLYRAVWSSC
jgi:hypothetical protein